MHDKKYSRILNHPDERLLTPCLPVDETFIQSGELFDLIAMLKMHLALSKFGIGIAANQIGGDRRVLVVSMRTGEEYVMVNPEITKRRGERMSGEQCLSVRRDEALTAEGLTAYYVVRPKAITVTFHEPQIVDENRVEFEQRTIKANGLLAACICHEVDHLDGITIVERAGEGQCRAS